MANTESHEPIQDLQKTIQSDTSLYGSSFEGNAPSPLLTGHLYPTVLPYNGHTKVHVHIHRHRHVLLNAHTHMPTPTAMQYSSNGAV